MSSPGSLVVSERGDDYIVVDNFLTPDEMSEIWKSTAVKEFKYGKVGTNVNKSKKLRKDTFYTSEECKYLDTIFFEKASSLVQTTFDVSLCFRERWKMGHYSGEEKGFYIPHTDTQGEGDTMSYRKISIVVVLSDPTEYEGGDLVFPNLKKTFRLKRGSAILFRSSLLHGVTPVTSGDRYVLISFTFDQDGGIKKLRNFATLSDYIPRCDPALLLEKPFKTLEDAPAHLIPEGMVAAAADTDSVTMAVSPSTRGKTATAAATATATATATKKSSSLKYLLPLTPDSGPGNQIVSIKEALIMSHFTKRICILPPICQHYRKTPKFWAFDEIYKYTGEDAILYKDMSKEVSTINKAHCIHPNYVGKELKLQKHLGLTLEAEPLAAKRRFRESANYKEMRDVSSNILCVKHLFNNTNVSQCGFNGCTECSLNEKLEPIYSKICAEFDFSDAVHGYAREFIHKKLGEQFIAIHMRYPDVMGTKRLQEWAGYHEGQIRRAILQFKKKMGIPDAKVFIATNNLKQVLASPLREFVVYKNDSDTGSSKDSGQRFVKRHTSDIDSFVEQCIAAQSAHFIMSKYNDYSKKDAPHQRSTWSSFIQDYRRFVRKMPSSDERPTEILITKLLEDYGETD